MIRRSFCYWLLIIWLFVEENATRVATLVPSDLRRHRADDFPRGPDMDAPLHCCPNCRTPVVPELISPQVPGRRNT